MSSRFEIVEGRAHHCGAMSRLLRTEHRDAIALIGVNAHRELRQAFDQSAFRRAWLVDGRLAALGGVTGSPLASSGEIWLAVTQEATRWPKAMLREAEHQIAQVLETRTNLAARIIGADAASYRFARRLGFHVAHPLPFGPGDQIVNMELRRDLRQNPVRRNGASDAPFIIYTAGRSRTAWLASFLTYADHRCHNEAAVKFKDMRGVSAFFGSHVGSAETSIAPGWRLLEHFVPGIRTVVVQRDPEDIVASFARMEIARIATVDEDRLRRIVAYSDRCLRELSKQPGVLTVRYADLGEASVCKAVFEHCLPYHFDYEWWREMSRRNIQSDPLEIVRTYQQNLSDVAAFKRDSKRLLASLVRSGEISRFGGSSSAVH